MDNAPQSGTFLGFLQTSCTALYEDTHTHQVKPTADIAFNEAEVGQETLLPNAKALQEAGAAPLDPDLPTKAEQAQWLDMHNSPWIGVQKVTVPLGNLDNTHPISCTVDHCACMRCPFLVNIHQAFSGMTKAALH